MTTTNFQYCIYGTGGFARETFICLLDMYASTNARIAEQTVFMVADDFYESSEVLGRPVMRQSEFAPGAHKVVVAVAEPSTRKRIVESLPLETEYASVVHPSVVMSQWVEVGMGAVLTAGTILTCDIKIGRHAHLNLNSTVGHDCVMGEYFTMAPGTNISGKCRFGECVYIGTNSAIREGINVCGDVTVGMGAVVVKDITEPGVYVGNPARKR